MSENTHNQRGKDITILVLSLLIAFSVWMIHNLSASYSQVISVSVTAQSNLPGRSSVSSNTEVVSARCRATGFRLLSSRRDEDKRKVSVFFAPEDLKMVEEGVYSVSAEDLTSYVDNIFGDGVRLESFIISEVVFSFDPENNKVVPVQLVSDLTFKPQYMLSAPVSVVPDSVVIYGDPQYLDKVEKVYTKSVRLDGISNNKHGVAKLEVPVGTRLSANEVNYSLDVSRFVEIHSLVPVQTRNVPYGRTLSVYPSQVNATLYCAFPVGSDPLEGLTFWIDYRDFASSLNGRCVVKTGKLPDGVIDCFVDPQVLECVEEQL